MSKISAWGTATTPSGLQVTVDAPCLLLIREEAEEKGLAVAIANPDREGLTVAMTVNRKLAGPNTTWHEQANATQVTFKLPVGAFTGQSVMAHLHQKNDVDDATQR